MSCGRAAETALAGLATRRPPADNLLLPGGPLRTAPPVPVACVEQLMGLCDTLEAKLKAAQVERERLVEAVVAGIAHG